MTSTETFFVENMRCAGCVNTIQTALSKMQGVQGVTTFLPEKKVCVMGIGIDRERIAKTLHKLGYPASGQNSMLRKAASYISCSAGR